ncbi:MAG: hypothetical protein ACE5EG_09660 [Thermoanaerobaculia bacterium]
MKRVVTAAALAITLVLMLLVPAAAEAGGNVARVSYWTVRDGHEADFEAGLAAHNQLHAAENDPTALLTWQIVSGKRNGQYLRASFGHEWADFDQESSMAEADAADAAKNLDPHIARDEPVFGVLMPQLSNPASGPPSGVSRVIYFHVRPGKQGLFQGVIGRIHAALSKVEGGWPPYVWYELASGSLPTYVVSLPRANWAGFAESDPGLAEVIAAEYGPEGMQEVFAALGEAVEHEHSYFSVFRADLSYIPASE